MKLLRHWSLPGIYNDSHHYHALANVQCLQEPFAGTVTNLLAQE